MCIKQRRRKNCVRKTKKGYPGFHAWSTVLAFLPIMAIIVFVGHKSKVAEIAESKMAVYAQALDVAASKSATLQAENQQLKDELETLKKNALTVRNQANQDFLTYQILPRTRKYNLPDALVAGQWVIESGRAVNKADNNYFGLGPHLKFSSLDEAIKFYNQTLRNILAHKGYDLDKVKDSVQILRDLQQGNYRYEGDSKNPQEYIQLVSEMPEFQFYYQLEGK